MNIELSTIIVVVVNIVTSIGIAVRIGERMGRVDQQIMNIDKRVVKLEEVTVTQRECASRMEAM